MINLNKAKGNRPDTDVLYNGSYCAGDSLMPEAPPIYMTSAFVMRDLDHLRSVDAVGGYSYGRGTNPTRDVLIEQISQLERAEDTVMFAAGMGAISTSLMTFAKLGDHVLANRDMYGETIDFLTNYMSKFGVEVSSVDFTDLDAVKAAVRPNTKVLYSEVISNPLTRIVDVRRIAEIAHSCGALYMVDSTFTTPFVLRPLEHGVDLVIHSLTKYFNGHSDASGGSVSGRKELTDKIKPLMLLLGSSLDPYNSWLILRGSRTMALRVRKQNENAAVLAGWLARCPKVCEVHHPSLSSHPQHKLSQELFLDGYGGAIVTFVLDGGVESINTLLKKLNIVHYLPSLGGYKTTLSHPVSSSHQDVPPETRKKMGIHEGMLRISVGCENVEDIISDFEQAFSKL